MLLAYGRPFWPLFLHVLGAMVLFGATLTTVIASSVALRRPKVAVLRRAALAGLAAAVPAFVVMRVFAEIIRSDEGYRHDLPGWIALGRSIADGGVLLLLVTIGCAYWWLRSGSTLPGRIVAALSSVYLVLLAIAWLAMSGKWGW